MVQRFPAAAVRGATQDLERHLESFLETLTFVRYAKKTREDKKRILERFFLWARASGLESSGVDESSIDAYAERVLGRPHQRGESEHATLHQFLAHLRRAGVVPPKCEPEACPSDVLVARYEDYLLHCRGLTARSVAVYAPLVRKFVAAIGAGDLALLGSGLNAEVVRGHLLERTRGRSSECTRLLATALRSFLRFLFLQGEATVDLSTAVPPVRRWQLAAVPTFLSPDGVEQVLSAIDRTTVQGRRDLAMLLLLARLGLRPGEVARLGLDDIHWTASELVVPGKGRCLDRLPLPQDVGEALALYLQHARGDSPSRKVFLRVHAPYVALSGPDAVCSVARQGLRRAGLSPRGRVAAHVFRHSLATRMIRHGASLGEIAQVLRHRSTTTTQIYAKVDFEALRGVARAWPIALGGDR